MSEVRFYHLQNQSLEQVLPILVGKAVQKGGPIVIYMGGEPEVERMNGLLWSAQTESFLPHGSAKDGIKGEDQPIFLTANVTENPNAAKIAFLTQGAMRDDFSDFDLVCLVFDGRDNAAVQDARTHWKALNADKEAGGLKLTYWQQSETGGWDKKA